MDFFGIRTGIRPRFLARPWLVPASAAFHLLVLALLLVNRPPHVAPVRLPGTRDGSHLVLTFAPGRSPSEQNATMPIPHVAVFKPLAIKQKVSRPDEQAASLHTPTPAPKPLDTTPGNDALGTGDVNIALLAVFPTPKPDLSQLPHGTKGDVVLDVVIDETGKIAQLTMERGVGHGVDESVIATVRQWAFHPATRNGKPVASEQELLFHFERS
jgi:protein TonB